MRTISNPARVVWTALALAGCAAPPPDRGYELSVSAGLFDVSDDLGVGRAGLEGRFPIEGYVIDPFAGVAVTNAGGVFAYGGLRRDFALGRGFELAPSLGAGFYGRGDGPDLGGELAFRSGLELSYPLEHGLRIGCAIYHLSNSSLYDDNPGVESVVLMLTWAPWASEGVPPR